MTDPAADTLALRHRNEVLLRRALDAEAALAALLRGEVDAVAFEASATPVLLVAAQERLRGSQQLLRAVFDSSLDAITLADDRGVFLDVNHAALTLFMLPREDVVGRAMSELVPLNGVAAETIQIRRADGSERVIEYRAVANVAPGVHLAVLRDITDHIAAEAAVRASHDQLEEAQSIAHVGSWSSGMDPDAPLEWSRESYRIYGIPEGTPMTVTAFDAFVHPDDRQRVHAATRAAIDGVAPAEIEHRIIRPDGAIRRVHQRGVVVRDEAGRAIRMHGTLQDITDSHAATTALGDSDQRYRRIVENTTDGVWMYDAEGVTTFMNARMAEMLGWTVREALGRTIYTFMDAGKVDAARERDARSRRGVAERSDLALCRKDGSKVLVSVGATPLFSAEGVFEATLCLVTDVSEQRRADETRAHLAAIVESSEDAIISTALDGAITSWNRGAERIYGYAAGEMLGRSVFAIIPDDVAMGQRDVLHRVAGGESVWQAECARVRKDQSRVMVAITVSPVRSAGGEVIGMSKIARDLTATRNAAAAHHRVEEQFRQAQKMEAVGRLAGGVAHDFNNLLTVILSYSEFAIEDLKSGDPLREDMLEIKQAAQRATVLTAQLLAFSRQQVLQPRVIDLNQVVGGMKAMLGRLLGEDVELGLVLDGDLGRVLADPGQIEQVVMNLSVNARDAMPDGGQLTIATSNCRIGADHPADLSDVTPGDYVLLAVTDTGLGIDAATRTRIFEPFFTTKAPGKGTGLGLSTVFGIVQQSHGHLGVDSEPGHGTTFKAYFPRTDQEVHPTATSGVLPVIRGIETILLVEDEEQVRTVACAILRRNGYHVLETSNGGEAFLVSKEFAGTIHLLLTDVVMPRMSGRKLAEELAEQRPAMKVLFASGYTDDSIIHHGVLEVGVAFLQKPFTPAVLLRRVRDVIDGAT